MKRRRSAGVREQCATRAPPCNGRNACERNAAILVYLCALVKRASSFLPRRESSVILSYTYRDKCCIACGSMVLLRLYVLRFPTPRRGKTKYINLTFLSHFGFAQRGRNQSGREKQGKYRCRSHRSIAAKRCFPNE